MDAVGNLYVADATANTVTQIVVASGAVSVLGSGFSSHQGIAMDAVGNVYVADTGDDTVKEIVAATGAVKTLASGIGISNRAAFFSSGVAVDAAGNVYVADVLGYTVKEVMAGTGMVNTLGSGFITPTFVAVDASGRVYVIDNRYLWEFKPRRRASCSSHTGRESLKDRPAQRTSCNVDLRQSLALRNQTS